MLRGQRGLCHWPGVSGSGLGQSSSRRHRRSPRGGGAAALDRQLDVVSGANDHVLGVLVSQVVDVDAVHLQDRIAGHEPGLVGQTAAIDLRDR